MGKERVARIGRRIGRHVAQRLDASVKRERLKCKLTDRLIDDALDDVLPSACDTLLIHSSFSSCGYVPGGPEHLISLFRSRAETVCFVTHSYCYPDVDGSVPIYDVRFTPSQVGKLSEVFRCMSGVTRSVHPTHSVAAIGASANTLCEDHVLCSTPCGQGTPYSKLLDSRASVVMYGATLDAYTLFHTVEDAANVPYLYEVCPYNLLARDQNDKIHQVKMYRQDMSVQRRFIEMEGVLERENLLSRVTLGCGQILCIHDSKSVHDYILDVLKKDPFYLTRRDRD